MTIIWIVIWLDRGTPQLHMSWWLASFIACLFIDFALEAASE